MKYFNLAAIAAIVLIPTITHAHTRWFLDGDLPHLPTDEPTALYLSLWTFIILITVAIGIFIEHRGWLQLKFLKPISPHALERAASTFTMVAGSFFIIAGTHEYLFSPNLTVAAGIPIWLIYLQILVGLAFLVGIASRICGLVLAVMWASLFFYTSWVTMFENILVLSTAIFIFLMGNEYFALVSFSFFRPIVASCKKYALSILRLGTGATLVILGFSEKLLAPEFGLNFLDGHPWNFMQLLGFNFSDYLFVLSAGSVEILFGVIFVLGVVTRLNALIVAVVFSIPLFILGPVELAGHLPHFAAIILLLLFGSGGYFGLMKK